MLERKKIDGKVIGQIYDQQAFAYTEFADQRYAWLYLEQPAFDRYIPDLYTPEIRVLDIGCGTGVVARHLVSQGVLPQNITGIDTSREQLKQARATTLGARFIETSAEEFDLPAGSIDLVTTNTVLHHLDNEQLEQMLNRVYDVLVPDGCYFFVDIDPDHSAEGRDSKNTNKWSVVKTPWGTDVPSFNRNPRDLVDMLDRHGFDKVNGWVLKVADGGVEDPENYAKYSSRPSRMAARYQKVSERNRILRVNDVRIPNLVETPSQAIQRGLVEQYFDAWRTQSLEKVSSIFTPNAIYDEKPEKEESLMGIAAIQSYWKRNPLSQRNIQLDSKIIGFSGIDSIWTDFNASFNVGGQHISIKGVIQFTVDLEVKKITKLSEYFTTEKIPSI